ncbi:MAG: ParA family protein [Polyangiaceae bacterium]|nr:ParA family protein [Polyangiaceae bacterium]
MGAPIVAVASAKGGVGKTTLTMNLAVALARRGLRVIVVDSDPNGGVSAAVNAHRRIQKGAFDIVCGAASVAEALVTTRMDGLRVLPAGGTALSIEQVESAQTHVQAWRALLGKLAKSADVVLLDTAGGAYGATRVMLGCATHVMGVLQAEPLAMRASDHFDRAIRTLNPAPKLVGITMNMFEPRGSTSTAVLQDACDSLAPGLLFDTAIPRTPIINEASLRGVIAGQGELSNAPAVAWTFEQLSAELLDRLGLARARPVLDESPLF